MNLLNIYLKPFVFQALSFEEYEEGTCTHRGSGFISINSKIIHDDRNYQQTGIDKYILFHIETSTHLNTLKDFAIPILGASKGDVISDRIQYGRLMNYWPADRSLDPVACHIFSNLSCLRLCFQNPMRIIEFTGQFISIG